MGTNQFQNTKRQADILPQGIIIPYNMTQAYAPDPTNWGLVAPQSNYIIGAKNSVNFLPTNTGGSSTVSFDSNDYSHPSDITDTLPCAYDPAGHGIIHDTAVNVHKHVITITPAPAHQKVRFYKCLTTTQKYFPPGSVLFSTIDLSHRYYSCISQFDQKYLKMASQTSGSVNDNLTKVIGSAGFHEDHQGTTGSNKNIVGGSILTNTGYYPRDISIPVQAAAAGYHTHGINSMIIQDAFRKIYLGAWTNINNKMKINSNAIAMWESLTPPTGWLLCDGLNSTPDLGGFLIYFDTTKTLGSTISSNELQIVSYSLLDDLFSHTHIQSGYMLNTDNIEDRYHTDATNTFNHGHLGTGTSFTPHKQLSYQLPYYALAFIIKI